MELHHFLLPVVADDVRRRTQKLQMIRRVASSATTLRELLKTGLRPLNCRRPMTFVSPFADCFKTPVFAANRLVMNQDVCVWTERALRRAAAATLLPSVGGARPASVFIGVHPWLKNESGDSFESQRLTSGHYLLAKQLKAGSRFVITVGDDRLPVIRLTKKVITARLVNEIVRYT